ncbi:BLUF domain-containing protein [Pontixanthobacter aestiaquae]|uniref:BLUF domain-containing protein n=1 Tax=Pontixanthobacter aestiaquae TaxID=1509367 RepID=UPI001928A2B9|nr:BLUF domain-containing protein [Pontixanthobacter aestiaquae]MDN3645251.1 BLUF domain-containing protein [Pontixanthobacter aestiaquae]
MKQLIYRSQPFGFDRSMLAGILMQARHNNKRDDITGALICRHDLYIQLIEGPAAAIDALYAKISEDDRHCDVRLALSDKVSDRMFPEWEMLDDEMPTLIWSPQEIVDGAIEKATPAALRAVFERVAEKARDRE